MTAGRGTRSTGPSLPVCLGGAGSRLPEADRRTLIRRTSFDLLGLPPTPAEIEALLDDPAPDAPMSR